LGGVGLSAVVSWDFFLFFFLFLWCYMMCIFVFSVGVNLWGVVDFHFGSFGVGGFLGAGPVRGGG
ncbi:hypothetical protein AAGG49_21870, partial [Stenotrophomonas maltophilia]|uniref:hypothetical protein n=1 Tax=Stenotrophomonas maltophilia TaxID=40324 RepID=UPI00313F25F0